MSLVIELEKLAEIEIPSHQTSIILEPSLEEGVVYDIGGVIPSHIKEIYLSERFTLKASILIGLDFLPEGLEVLDLMNLWRGLTAEDLMNLPKSLRVLRLKAMTELPIFLPDGLKEFEVRYCPIDFSSILPKGLERLTFGSNHFSWKDKFPPALKSFNIFLENYRFDFADIETKRFLTAEDILSLPPTLEELTVEILGKNYESIPENSFPPTLKSLKCRSCEIELKKNILPSTLKHFDLGFYKLKLEPDVLPVGLTSVTFFRFNGTLKSNKKNILPSTVKELYLPIDFRQELRKGDLHEGLEVLHINNLKITHKPEFPSTLHTIRFSDHKVPKDCVTLKNLLDSEFLKEYFPEHITEIYYHHKKIR